MILIALIHTRTTFIALFDRRSKLLARCHEMNGWAVCHVCSSKIRISSFTPHKISTADIGSEFFVWFHHRVNSMISYSQRTRDVEPVLFYCWSSVVDAWLTLKQNCVAGLLPYMIRIADFSPHTIIITDFGPSRIRMADFIPYRIATATVFSRDLLLAQCR